MLTTISLSGSLVTPHRPSNHLQIDNYLEAGPGRRNILIADSFEGDDIDGGDDRGHRNLDRRVRDREDAEAQRIAAEYKNRHRNRRQGMGIQAMQDFAPRSVLMPSVNDPNIYLVKCKVGGISSYYQNRILLT